MILSEEETNIRSAVVYISIHHGNTKKIAETIAEELNADLFDLQREHPDLGDYNLIGFGSGIYFWKHHEKLLDFVKHLPNMDKKAFIFSTSGLIMRRNHRVLRNLLKERRFDIIGEFYCKGYDTFSFLRCVGGINKGRPNEEDVKRAQNFASKLKSFIQSFS